MRKIILVTFLIIFLALLASAYTTCDPDKNNADGINSVCTEPNTRCDASLADPNQNIKGICVECVNDNNCIKQENAQSIKGVCLSWKFCKPHKTQELADASFDLGKYGTTNIYNVLLTWNWDNSYLGDKCTLNWVTTILNFQIAQGASLDSEYITALAAALESKYDYDLDESGHISLDGFGYYYVLNQNDVECTCENIPIQEQGKNCHYNFPPKIQGNTLGIIYNKYENKFSITKTSDNSGEIINKVIPSIPVATGIILTDKESKIEELTCSLGETEQLSSGSSCNAFSFNANYDIDNKYLPIALPDESYNAHVWLGLTDSGILDGKLKQTTKQEMNAILCPQGTINLGTLSSTLIWGGGSYNEPGIDIEKVYNEVGGIKINFNKAIMIISPNAEPEFELDIKVHLQNVGWFMMSMAKDRLKKSGVEIFRVIADKLPRSGTGDIQVSIKTLTNPTCEKYTELTINRNFGELITDHEDLTFAETVALIKEVLSETDKNAQISCGGYEEKRTKSGNKETVECKVGSLVSKSWKLKGWKITNPDGSFEYEDFNIMNILFRGSFIAYDQGKHVKSSLVLPGKIDQFLTCTKKCDTPDLKTNQKSSGQSIYALRKDGLGFNGYAYQFLPSPLTFNKEVTRTFDKTIYVEDNFKETSIFNLDEKQVFDNCNSHVIKSVNSTISPDKNNTIQIGGLTYDIPEGAVNSNTDITINLLYLYDCYCNNKIQDNDEAGIDCGGSCSEECSPSCDDRVQNRDEIGVDCGGEYCMVCDYTFNPDCNQDLDCNEFCSNSVSKCFYNSCFCLSSCGDNICDFGERFFNTCEKDCPACDNIGDLNYDCRISLPELLKFISKWTNKEVTGEELLKTIDYWLS